MKCLILGSGLSSSQKEDMELSDYFVIAVNNAWRIFENEWFHLWFHSGDFQKHSWPTQKNYAFEVGYFGSKECFGKISEVEGWPYNPQNPAIYIGSNVFFCVMYWTIYNIRPQQIDLLGFDFDYNKEKVDIWKKIPTKFPTDKFLEESGLTIDQWYKQNFGELRDTVYGMGTPDASRFSPEYIKEKMFLLKGYAEKHGVKITNLSKRGSVVNIF